MYLINYLKLKDIKKLWNIHMKNKVILKVNF